MKLQHSIHQNIALNIGAKNVYNRYEKGKPKDRTTVTYAFSASVDHVQPLIIFKDSTSTLQEIAYARSQGEITNFFKNISINKQNISINKKHSSRSYHWVQRPIFEPNKFLFDKTSAKRMFLSTRKWTKNWPKKIHTSNPNTQTKYK